MYDATIHHNGTHTNQHIIVNNATMHHGIMSYRNTVPNFSWIFLIGTMDDCPILNIYFVANFNIMHISSYNSVKPYTAFIAHYYIAYNSGVGCNKTICTHLRVFAKYR